MTSAPLLWPSGCTVFSWMVNGTPFMRCSRVTPKRWASGRSTSCGRRSLRKKPPIAAFAADHGTNPAGSISSRSFCAMAMPWPCGMRSSAKRHAAASHAVVRETGVQDARLFCEYAANASGKVTNILSRNTGAGHQAKFFAAKSQFTSLSRKVATKSGRRLR